MVKDKINERISKPVKLTKDTGAEDIVEHKLVVKALSRLNAIITKEEDLINQKKYSEAAKLIPDKLELVSFFEKYRDKILKDYAQDKEKNSEKIEDVKKLVQSLLSTSSRNMNKIKKAQYVSSKTMEIVKNIITKSETEHKNYSKTGDKNSKSKVSKHILLNTEV